MIGIIGCGNMGKSMIEGISNSGLIEGSQIGIFDINKDKVDELSSRLGVISEADETAVFNNHKYIIIAVKPNGFEKLFKTLGKVENKSDKVVISIGAGIKIASLEKMSDKNYRFFRAMPNLPVLVGEGMSAISHRENVSEGEVEFVKSIFDSFGKGDIVDESLMDVVVGISGSSPAYVFMIIEAMADGAVLKGMPRDKAYKYAAQTLMGTAKMLLESKEHPGLLKDRVCSPGGTTIEAVKVLEDSGLRSAMIKAVVSATEKSEEMGKK
jgi:pyrroline-5-carboxylate reductase